jgi:hypothetical protein
MRQASIAGLPTKDVPVERAPRDDEEDEAHDV